MEQVRTYGQKKEVFGNLLMNYDTIFHVTVNEGVVPLWV